MSLVLIACIASGVVVSKPVIGMKRRVFG